MKAYQVTAVGFDDDDFCLRKTCNNVTVGFQYSKFRLTSEGQVAEQVIYAMALSFFIILPPPTLLLNLQLGGFITFLIV